MDQDESQQKHRDALLMPPPASLPKASTPTINNNNNSHSAPLEQEKKTTNSFLNTLSQSFTSFISNVTSSKTDDDLIIEKSPQQDAEEVDESNVFPAINSFQRASSQYTTPQRLDSASSGPGIRRQKVALGPGYSPLDWAKLQNSGKNLAGVMRLERYTPSQLAQHSTKQDCWIAFQGKVYNITPYLGFHPGGVGQLMRAAGKDGTALFMQVHSWVNVDRILEKCLVGYLIPERGTATALK